MKNDGKDAQDQFIEAMEATGRWVHRFRDKKDMMALNRGKRVGTFANPADYMCGENGRYFLAEVKSTQNKTSFPYGNMEPAQKAAAAHAASRGSPFFFFILDMNTQQWYVLSAPEFVADLKAGKKSRSFKELTPCSLMSWSI